MTDENIENKIQKLQWETPLLESIGNVADVAAGAGLGAEDGHVGS